MSLLKVARKKSMRTYYIKPNSKGKTTAYVCYQYYDRVAKRTIGVPYLSFNISTNPNAPETHVTDSGKTAGYTVSTEHLADIMNWLKRHGTFGKHKVPPRILALVRAEAELKVRAELGLPSQPNAGEKSAPPTVGEKIRALCKATDDLLEHITQHKRPKECFLGSSRPELFALRLHLNFGEKALRYALRSVGVTATDFAPATLPAEATEALRRGYIKEEDIETAKQAKSKSEASKAARTRKSTGDESAELPLPTISGT